MLRNAPLGLLYAEVRFLASEFAQWLPASRFRPRWCDSIWSCIDEETGVVLALDESGLTETPWSLHTWLTDWLRGEKLFGKMFTFDERRITNPFTKQPMLVRTPAGAIGTPYKRVKFD